MARYEFRDITGKCWVCASEFLGAGLRAAEAGGGGAAREIEGEDLPGWELVWGTGEVAEGDGLVERHFRTGRALNWKSSMFTL
jgi:hypothetical protein